MVPVLLLGATATCLGQENPDPSPPATIVTQLQPIIVTATKRRAPLREIPETIDYLPGSQIQSQAITSQRQLVRLTPGVTWANAADDTSRIIIRGVAPGSKGELNNTTKVMFGDIPFENSYAPRFTPDPLPFDLKDVEVMQGPQGTLFGSGSLNGTVRYVFQPAEYKVFRAKYMLRSTSIDYGGTGFTEAGGVNIPIGGKLAIRVVGNHVVDPGYNDDLTPVPPTYTSTLNLKNYNWRHKDGARVLIGWRPNARWEVNLHFIWEKSDANGSSVVNNLNGVFQNTNQRFVGFYKYHYSIGGLKITRHFADFNVVSVTSLQSSHESHAQDLTASIVGDANPATTGGYVNVAQDPGVNTRAVTQEIRFVSTDTGSPWQWVAGVNYAHQTAKGSSDEVNFSDTGIPPAALGPFAPYVSFREKFISAVWNVKITELAAFAHVTRAFFGNELKFSLGGRFYHYRSAGQESNSGTLIELTNFQLPGSGLVITNSGTLNQNGFNPMASVTWQPSDSVMAFATISRGFRLGGIQSGWSGFGATQAPPKFVKSDYLWNYEAGLRTTWLHNTLHADITGFHYNWKNAQYTESIPSKGAFYTTNVGAVTGNGFQAALRYLLPIHGLSVNASGAYTDVKTAVGFPTALGTVPSGTQWPGSFTWQTATSLNYSTAIDRVGLDGALIYTTLSGGASPFGNRPQGLGYREWNAQLGVNLFDSDWFPKVTLIVRNLTNDKGIVDNLNDGSLTGAPYTYVTYVQPRTFVVQLTKSF